MAYFVFRLRWSETDSSTTIVQANSEEEARAKIKGNARYIEYRGRAEYIIG